MSQLDTTFDDIDADLDALLNQVGRPSSCKPCLTFAAAAAVAWRTAAGPTVGGTISPSGMPEAVWRLARCCGSHILLQHLLRACTA
jgi:hypothetical protein